MAFDFPASPPDGTKFSPAGGPTYVFGNGVWKIEGSIGAPGNLSMSDTPPPNPQNGQMWWETDTGNLFGYFNDGDSSQWVQINIPSVTGLTTAQTRNRIVNGGVQISQENGRAAGAANGYWAADQWQCSVGGPTSNAALSIEGDPLVDQGQDYLQQFGGGTAFLSPAATNLQYIYQPIEGLRVADFQWGTAQAKPAVLRFRAWMNTGSPFTFSVAIRHGGATHSFVQNFVATTTPTDFAMPIPGPTVGTWPVNNTAAMGVCFTSMCGTTYTTSSPRAWVAGNFVATTGIGNLFTGGSLALNVSNIGLYLDPDNTGTPPRWEMPDEAQELLTCRRYWQRAEGGLRTASPLGYVGAPVYYTVPMRVVPALGALIDGGVVSAANKWQANYGQTVNGFQPQFNVGANTDYYNYGFTIVASARM